MSWYADQRGSRSGWIRTGGSPNRRLSMLGDSPHFYVHLAAAFEQHCHCFLGDDQMPIARLSDYLDRVLARGGPRMTDETTRPAEIDGPASRAGEAAWRGPRPGAGTRRRRSASPRRRRRWRSKRRTSRPGWSTWKACSTWRSVTRHVRDAMARAIAGRSAVRSCRGGGPAAARGPPGRRGRDTGADLPRRRCTAERDRTSAEARADLRGGHVAVPQRSGQGRDRSRTCRAGGRDVGSSPSGAAEAVSQPARARGSEDGAPRARHRRRTARR